MHKEHDTLSIERKSLIMFFFLSAGCCMLLCSAGCVFPENTETLPPTELLTEKLDLMAEAVSAKAVEADARLMEVSHKLETASPEETEKIIRTFYIDNIKLQAVGYYDSLRNYSYTTPFANVGAVDLQGFYENISFDGHKTILYGPITTDHHGVTYAFVHPVYTNGVCSGMVASIFDPVAFITNAALDCGGLDGLGVQVCDTNGTVFYSPFASDIGQNFYHELSGRVSEFVFQEILNNTSGVSMPFPSFTPGLQTELVKRQAAWKTIFIADKEFRIAVTSCEETPDLPADYKPEYAEMEKAVRNAYIYAYTHGKDETIAELNNIHGQFVYDDFDVFAISLNGTLLASQKRPYQVGSSMMNWRSAYGMRTIETMADIAKTSGGGYYYFTMAVSEDPTEEEGILSATYIMLVDSDWFIASIIPAQAERTPVLVDMKNSMLPTMQTALFMYLEEGEAAFEKYMYREGTPLEGNDQNIMVVDKNGTLLSFTMYPYLVGTNALSMTIPSTGVSLTRMLLMKAESGGGFTTADIYSADTGQNNISILYVEPLDDGSFIIVTKRTGTYIVCDEMYLREGEK